MENGVSARSKDRPSFNAKTPRRVKTRDARHRAPLHVFVSDVRGARFVSRKIIDTSDATQDVQIIDTMQRIAQFCAIIAACKNPKATQDFMRS